MPFQKKSKYIEYFNRIYTWLEAYGIFPFRGSSMYGKRYVLIYEVSFTCDVSTYSKLRYNIGLFSNSTKNPKCTTNKQPKSTPKKDEEKKMKEPRVNGCIPPKKSQLDPLGIDLTKQLGMIISML